MNKILIIGAGVEQVGAIKIAKDMGLNVVVSDMNPNAPAIKFADTFYKISTTDIIGNIEIGKKENINGVMTVCSETAVPTVAHVANKLNLPCFSIDTANKATNKSEMRNVLSENNIRVAPYTIADTFNKVIDFTNEINGPWVLKPVDSSGQRGASVISNKNLLQNAFNEALLYSNTKEVLVDKFVEGQEVHVTMQVINKKVHFLAFSDRITLNRDNFGIAVRHIGPSILDSNIKYEIIDLCEKSIKAINLENGVATCELIIENNKAFLIELAIRVPGGYLREVAMYLSGVDIYKTTVWNCLGENKRYDEIVTEKSYPAVSVKFISAINLNPKIKKITKINDIKQLETNEIKLINLHFNNEFEVPELKSSVGRFAAIIGIGSSREQAVKRTENVFNLIEFNRMNLKEYNNYNEFNVDFSSYLN